MNIVEIKKALLIKYPLFGNTIINTNFIFDNNEHLFSYPAYTDGKNVYYTNTIKDFTFDEQVFIMAHELLHIALKHCFRNPGRNHDVLNFVTDAIINQLLVRDGLTMPEGCINVPDALEYSSEELYMKYIDQSAIIHEIMSAFYHPTLKETVEELENKEDVDPTKALGENNEEKKKLIKSILNGINPGKGTSSTEEYLSEIGRNKQVLNWKEILESNLKSSDEYKTIFYEVELDGIIRKITEPDINGSNTEIVIDSSGSMSTKALKAIIRECKNILKTSCIKIRFCDTKLYDWIEIYDENDLDNVRLKGRGGTDFYEMAKGFTSESDNKIIITDGFGWYPKECDDILWIIVEEDWWYGDRDIPDNIRYMKIKLCDLEEEYDYTR